MTSATLETRSPLPALREDSRLTKWREQLAQDEARHTELLAQSPGLRAMSQAHGVGPHQAAYAAAHAELRDLESRIADTSRAIYQATQEDRSRWGHELASSREFRSSQKAALLAYADSLTEIGELFAMYHRASRMGAHLSPALPVAVSQDLDAVTRWAKELIRLEIVKPGDLPSWLAEVLA